MAFGVLVVKKLARWPAASVPTSFSERSARAAFRLIAQNASAGNNFICVHPKAQTICKLAIGLLPGLKSVAIANGKPASIKALPGAYGIPKK